MFLLAISPLAADPLVVFFIDPTFDEYSGDAILVCTPGGRHYLIDGGMYSTWDPQWDCGSERILPLLDSLGVTYLDGVVGTHPDADHIGGLISVFETLDVVRAYDSGWPYGGTWVYADYLESIEGNISEYIVPRTGDLLDWGPELSVQVLHPSEPLSPSNTNNASIVIRLVYGETAFLFTGDLETDGGEDSVLASIPPEDLSADVLKVAHHGSWTSTCNAWLAAVDPSIAAICVGAGNPYGHPHGEVLDRLAARGITVYRTDVDGTFYISSDGTDLYYNSMPSQGGGPEPPTGFAVYPSPATQGASFSWDVSVGQTAFLSLYNLNGEKVLEVTASGGVYSWNLVTEDGGVAAPGLYAAVFRTEGGACCTEYFTVSR
jgi:competence protein ComEC